MRGVDIISFVALCFALRSWNFEQEAVREKAKYFRFAEAMCTVECDRDVVQRNITALMIHAGLADKDNAIEAFDELVHREIPQHVHRCFGRISVPYHYFCLLYTSPSPRD